MNECDNAVDNNCNTTTSICAETTCGFECIPCPGIYIIIHLSNLNRFDVIITRYIEFDECDNAEDNNCDTMCVDTPCGFECTPNPGT